jgi:tRNA pseudouridine38/39 synthase
MQDAAARLVGEHNFQNFCKMNVLNTTQHVRKIIAVELTYAPVALSAEKDVLQLYIKGSSFLWHQVCLSHTRRKKKHIC